MSWDDADRTGRPRHGQADDEPTQEFAEPTVELPTGDGEPARDRAEGGDPPAAAWGPGTDWAPEGRPPAPEEGQSLPDGTQSLPDGNRSGPEGNPPALDGNPSVSALSPPDVEAGTVPLASPGSATAYRQVHRSTGRRSFGETEQSAPGNQGLAFPGPEGEAYGAPTPAAHGRPDWFGQTGQGPYGPTPSGQAPFGQAAFGQAAFGQFGQGQGEHGQNMSGPAQLGQGQHPYGPLPAPGFPGQGLPGQGFPAPFPGPQAGYQPAYVPPPPPDWHQQQARAYTPAPPPKANRMFLVAGLVALVTALITAAGVAALVVTLDGGGVAEDQAAPPVGTGADPKIRSGSVSAVAQTLLPSVVQLNVRSGDQRANGSGFVIDGSGHVLTNNHVVAPAAQGGTIEVVTQQGRTATARLVGRSPAYDLAVVQVQGLDVPSVQFGRSELAVVGQDVVAIGSPLGLAGTVTSGIVSARNRPVTAGGEGEISYINALQTDAAINPGNSGGPLVDMNARVIGVNSAIATVRGAEEGGSGNIGLGFAIPIDQARRTAQQLIATGKASYPTIGANVDLRFEGGARLTDVTPASPASRAGLRSGDVVISIDNQPVDTAEALIVAIRTHRPGERVRLTYQRSGADRQATVTLGQQTG